MENALCVAYSFQSVALQQQLLNLVVEAATSEVQRSTGIELNSVLMILFGIELNHLSVTLKV